jgi:hypothetical protein
MPFAPQNIYRFTRPSISRALLSQRGVYGIYNEKHWIFIGSSDDIRASLIEHWETDAVLGREQPTGFMFEASDVPRVRAALLIAEYRPVLNERPCRPLAV